MIETKSKMQPVIPEKSRILKEHHVDFIKGCTDDATGPLLTLTTPRDKINKQFADIHDVSLPTIAKMLKRDLRMSYKKLSKIQAKATTTESINWMIKLACLLKRLSKDLESSSSSINLHLIRSRANDTARAS